MKKLLMIMFVGMIIILSLSLVSATSGSIWTTRENCEVPQDENEYDIGEHVWIRGDNFAEGEYDWEIKGQPGQASCDPNQIITSGSYAVDETGAFCFNAYTVADDDCGVYKADFNNKKDNYHVIPEFGFFIGALTIMGAIGVFFFIRRQ